MNSIKLLVIAAVFQLFQTVGVAQEQAYQLPAKTSGVKNNIISLNGEWQFKFDDKSDWDVIQVPGEAVMQGYGIEHDKSFYYKRNITVPADYSGKRVILRFDGVYSKAILFVNGKEIRRHVGGFTRWETDITEHVKVGASNEIALEVQDPQFDISYASGYAHHPIGGILRDVTLFATAKNSLLDFSIETDLDKDFKDAVLKMEFYTSESEAATVNYQLFDANDKLVNAGNHDFKINKGHNVNSFDVKNPLKWDAEHPNLYLLKVSVKREGQPTYEFSKEVGFREVKVVGDQMLVNGKPVKLRGANRHDVHPTLGRVATAYYDSLDVQLFKDSHINFVRTSHYPPTERFVEFCNREGIYVEVETAVCFVDTYRQKNYAPGATQDDPAHTDQYVGQCREMVKTFKSHPSVIIWSIGNESIYGMNFRKSWDYVKGADQSRPVIWSYPGAQKDDSKIYEILSMHYQDVHGNLSQFGKTTEGYEGHGIPALFDEWAHPACYTYQTLRDDPNIREFWAISMDMMWGGLFPKKGGLGGAIWGYVDETFMIPQQLKKGAPFWNQFAKTAKPEGYQGAAVGYGEWGIVDVWRRPKPEFWATKKAQSPIRITLEGKVIKDFKANQAITVPVYNRYDHTVLDEVKLEYTYRGKKHTTSLPAIQPHEQGEFTIPAGDWAHGESVLLNFISSDGRIVDTYAYYFGERPVELPQATHKGALKLSENAKFYTIKGDNFSIPVSKASGLIEGATKAGKVFIKKGPFMNMDVNLNHLTGAEVRKSANKFLVSDSDWTKESVDVRLENGAAIIRIAGSYKDLKAYFDIRISAAGEMTTDYRTEGEPNGYLREIGLKYHLADVVDQLNWERDGFWNYYPAGEFAGNAGEVKLFDSKQAAYGEKPVQPWDQDTHNYYYWADRGARSNNPLTNKAKGMKEDVYYYSLSAKGNNLLAVVSEEANVACRMDRLEDEQLVLFVNNKWDYPEIAWGNYCKTLEASPVSGKLNIRF